jgi:sensor histidine kinase YesM
MDCADAATKVGAAFAFFFGLPRHRITELSSIRSRHPAKAFTPGYAVFVGRQVERLQVDAHTAHPTGGGATPLNATQPRVRGGSVVWTAWLPSALLRTCQVLTWRRAATVLILCLILSTQVLAQPDLFEHWSLDRILEGWSYYFAEVSLTGFAMLAGFAFADSISVDGPRRAVAVGIALPASAALGYALAVELLYSPAFSVFSMQFVGDTLRLAVLGGAVAFIYMLRRRSDAAAKATHETKVARQTLDRQTLEARLQLMEAQIEPHFLFNSLANVQRLYEIEPESGERLLENLKTYLRAALPQMREKRRSLASEVELARAYLEVLQARMGERLQFDVDVAAGLRDHPFPPMMVITLVENAIKHGVDRSPSGGTIVVRAHRNGGHLTVEVADTGVGFRGNSGKGVGLANIRARLHALFGDRAELSLCANEPSGVVAAIAIPVQ